MTRKDERQKMDPRARRKKDAPRLVPCPECDGMGTWRDWGSDEDDPEAQYERCSWCYGTGEVPEAEA